jgi:hypothetical protein
MRVDKLCGWIIKLHDWMCGVPVSIRIPVWNRRYVNAPVKWWSGVKCCKGGGQIFHPFAGKQITNHPPASLGSCINFQMLVPGYGTKSPYNVMSLHRPTKRRDISQTGMFLWTYVWHVARCRVQEQWWHKGNWFCFWQLRPSYLSMKKDGCSGYITIKCPQWIVSN